MTSTPQFPLNTCLDTLFLDPVLSLVELSYKIDNHRPFGLKVYIRNGILVYRAIKLNANKNKYSSYSNRLDMVRKSGRHYKFTGIANGCEITIRFKVTKEQIKVNWQRQGFDSIEMYVSSSHLQHLLAYHGPTN